MTLAVEARLPEPGGACGSTVGLHRLGDELIFQVEHRYAFLQGRRFTELPDRTRGLPARGFTVLGFLGGSPDTAWAEVRHECSWQDGGFEADLYRWEKDHWRRAGKAVPDAIYEPWYPGDGSTGAIIHTFQGVHSASSRFIMLDGAPNGGLPRLATIEGRGQRLAVLESLALPTGHLFVLGIDAMVQEHDRPVIERFEPGKPAGVLEHLPLPAGSPRRLEWWSLAGRSASDVYVTGVLADPPEHHGPTVTYLAHFDGKTWRQLPVPQGLWSPHTAVTDDGALWVLTDTSDANPAPAKHWSLPLLQRSSDGVWAQVQLRAADEVLGEDVVPSRALAHGDALWLITLRRSERDRLRVYTTENIEKAFFLGPAVKK